MPKGLVLSLLIAVCGQIDYAQDYLLLTKKNRPYRVKYYAGDEMRFKLKGEKHYYKALIKGFESRKIIFHYYSIDLSEIEVIDVSGKNFTVFSFRSSPGKLLVSGMALLAIDQFNQTVIREEPFGVNGNLAIVGGAISLTGIVLKLIQKKRWKMLKPKHKADIILE